jgi:N-glycosylase/DNA lyase
LSKYKIAGGFMKELIFNNVKDFELEHIFECGQCFRWKKEEDGSYTGVVGSDVANVRKEKDSVIISGLLHSNAEKKYREYFDLNRDYSKIKRALCNGDETMKQASKFGCGIRILKQDPWEMLISFIISAANNIPRISKTIENISKKYGKELKYNGNIYYSFPTPKELSKASIEDLRKLNLGFRDKYVFEATRLVLNNTIDLEKIASMPIKDAKKELTQIPGVGLKVADCILLFSMNKLEAFPVDTWIKKVMSEIYTDNTNISKISEFAYQKFGKYGGIAQQYLFYFRRNN